MLRILCPYCKTTFKKEAEVIKKSGLFTIFIKQHPKSDDCPPFIAFIDDNGKHRGSQKIDNIEEESSVNDNFLENARERIAELSDKLRFYHLKVPRKGGRGFEYKVASVTDRGFMSSKKYSTLVDYLGDNDEENIFGVITLEQNSDFEGGLLIYGKYLGMSYTIFWKDQKSLQSKALDDLKGEANLTIEKLLDLYDLMDLFF